MDRSTTNLGDAVAVRLNFGLFDRVEIGVAHLWNAYVEQPAADRTANLKFQLLKEPETGAIPSIAIGIEQLGRDIVFWEADESASAFLAISKTFNPATDPPIFWTHRYRHAAVCIFGTSYRTVCWIA